MTRARAPHLLEEPAGFGHGSAGVSLHGVSSLAKSNGLAGGPGGLK